MSALCGQYGAGRIGASSSKGWMLRRNAPEKTVRTYMFQMVYMATALTVNKKTTMQRRFVQMANGEHLEETAYL